MSVNSQFCRFHRQNPHYCLPFHKHVSEGFCEYSKRMKEYTSSASKSLSAAGEHGSSDRHHTLCLIKNGLLCLVFWRNLVFHVQQGREVASNPPNLVALAGWISPFSLSEWLYPHSLSDNPKLLQTWLHWRVGFRHFP